MQKKSFQEIIFSLQQFWHNNGCTILQPYDHEVGAGTFHPATFFGALGKKDNNVAFVQPSRRPTDSRFGKHPNRLSHYYQFQVLLKPSPDNIQALYLESIKNLGINQTSHDIRFVEDDWESPTLGASGLGWEVWCNGMEISQFTYMQQMAGVNLSPVTGEITYGIERIALYIQEKENVKDLVWNKKTNQEIVTYGDIFNEQEKQLSAYNLNHANIDKLLEYFKYCENECKNLVSQNLPIAAYDFCIKSSHTFNILDARKAFSVTERAKYIFRIRSLAKLCALNWISIENNKNE